MKTTLYVIQICVLAYCVLLWVFRIGAKRRTGSMMRLRLHEPSPIGVFDIGVTFCIWFGLQFFGFFLIYIFMGLVPTEINSELPPGKMLEVSGWIMLAQLMATVAAIAWFLYRHGTVGWLGTRANLPMDIVVGLAGSLMLIPVVLVIQSIAIQFIPYTHETLDSLVKNFSLRTAAWAWFAAVGVAPLTEEFFFRGVLQGWLQRVFDYDEPIEARITGGLLKPETARALTDRNAAQGILRFWSPIVIASAAFAFMHMGQGPAPIPLFFLSLGIGYLFRQTGSLVPCVVVHLVLNSFSMIILTLSIIFPELQTPVEVELAPAWTGILF